MGFCGVRRTLAGDGVAEMPGDRLYRIVAAFSAGGDGWSSAWLCGVCPGLAGVSGAGVMLMSGEIPRGSLCASDEVSHLIEELQYTLGEGPCVDAYQQDRVVAEPDLADPVTRRWLAFTPPAVMPRSAREAATSGAGSVSTVTLHSGSTVSPCRPRSRRSGVNRHSSSRPVGTGKSASS